ncbi:MAG: hypothetical protein JXQ90_18330 [Cyclobacteriaceae bacterium]
MKKLFTLVIVVSLSLTSCDDLCTEDCGDPSPIEYSILNDLDTTIRLETYGAIVSNQGEYIPNQTESILLNPSDTSETWNTYFDAVGDDDSYSILFSGTGLEGSYPLFADSLHIFINDQLIKKFNRKVDRQNRDSTSIFFWDAYARIEDGNFLYSLDSSALDLK